jgi:catechol 2,3-dioxygenase-like lactoylglutathione lyase family enzyme
MPRLFDHIDLRVRTLAEGRDFYEVLLPALGFVRETRIPNWLQYEAAAPDDGAAAFFGVTESPGHVPNENRIAFWAESPAEVDRLAGIATRAGAQNIEGPGSFRSPVPFPDCPASLMYSPRFVSPYHCWPGRKYFPELLFTQ